MLFLTCKTVKSKSQHNRFSKNLQNTIVTLFPLLLSFFSLSIAIFCWAKCFSVLCSCTISLMNGDRWNQIIPKQKLFFVSVLGGWGGGWGVCWSGNFKFTEPYLMSNECSQIQIYRFVSNLFFILFCLFDCLVLFNGNLRSSLTNGLRLLFHSVFRREIDSF